MKYIVYVDDNFHHGEVKERYMYGEFECCQGAVDACRKIVDDYMAQRYRAGISFKEMWDGYVMFGEDPFILSNDPCCRFSAWSYAKQRCMELCL